MHADNALGVYMHFSETHLADHVQRAEALGGCWWWRVYLELTSMVGLRLRDLQCQASERSNYEDQLV